MRLKYCQSIKLFRVHSIPAQWEWVEVFLFPFSGGTSCSDLGYVGSIIHEIYHSSRLSAGLKSIPPGLFFGVDTFNRERETLSPLALCWYFLWQTFEKRKNISSTSRIDSAVRQNESWSESPRLFFLLFSFSRLFAIIDLCFIHFCSHNEVTQVQRVGEVNVERCRSTIGRVRRRRISSLSTKSTSACGTRISANTKIAMSESRRFSRSRTRWKSPSKRSTKRFTIFAINIASSSTKSRSGFRASQSKHSTLSVLFSRCLLILYLAFWLVFLAQIPDEVAVLPKLELLGVDCVGSGQQHTKQQSRRVQRDHLAGEWSFKALAT